ncbi:MAG: LacI family DNA-binding transcriptional regulator [Candidatus Omnitrophica bacterium]|jgi:DNA-binding LacI/PurR family transcriptional regulator|nr:LacI family DNA-binding transcriptional regulator [Candidatus Omnitrophota bacterium]
MAKNTVKTRKGKFPSIDDVAGEAGVSIATVSRVINNIGSVKERNKLKVLEAVDKLNFKPNISASRLASNKVNSVGLIMPVYDDMFGSFFFTELMKGIRDVVFPARRDLILLYNVNEPEDDFYRRILNKTYIGGLILELGALEINPILGKSDIPYVVVNGTYDEPRINYISVSNRTGAHDAVKYLIGMGHSRIATIHGALNIQSGRERLEGYTQALEESGIPVSRDLILDGNFFRKTAYEKMTALLGAKEPPTAVFVASDEMALGAIKAVKDKGLNVPGDISLVGFDDNPMCSELSPKLTTVRQPITEMGRLAAETIIKLIDKEEKPGVKKTLATELITRDSCRRIP